MSQPTKPAKHNMLQLIASHNNATTAAQLERLCHFIGRSQRQAIRYGLAGEEGGHFADILADLCATVDAMPKPYETENQGENAIVHLHYFKGGCDWWITERDSSAQQLQAFGLASLGYEPELGYISIDELLAEGVELDLYWTPRPLADILQAQAA
jgi:hypothetical protein